MVVAVFNIILFHPDVTHTYTDAFDFGWGGTFNTKSNSSDKAGALFCKWGIHFPVFIIISEFDFLTMVSAIGFNACFNRLRRSCLGFCCFIPSLKQEIVIDY